MTRLNIMRILNLALAAIATGIISVIVQASGIAIPILFFVMLATFELMDLNDK